MIEKQTTMRFKLLLILISAICNSSFGQKIALIDTKFKTPILFTDSVSVNQVSNALLPIRVDEFDTLNAHLEFLKKVLSDVDEVLSRRNDANKLRLIYQKQNSIRMAQIDMKDFRVLTDRELAKMSELKK